jgi:hypothetical protein
LLIMSRNQLRIMTGLLTGHCRLKGHLFKLELINSAKCDRCKQASETAQHILCDCEALATLRFRHLGHHFMKPGNFVKLLHFVQVAGVLNEWSKGQYNRSITVKMHGLIGALSSVFYCILIIILCVGCSVISKIPWW